MLLRIASIASAALLACGVWAESALAAPGDAVVPAHRTKSGHYVPANVPPMSSGTRLVTRPGTGSRSHRAGDQATTTVLIPLFAEARPIRR